MEFLWWLISSELFYFVCYTMNAAYMVRGNVVKCHLKTMNMYIWFVILGLLDFIFCEIRIYRFQTQSFVECRSLKGRKSKQKILTVSLFNMLSAQQYRWVVMRHAAFLTKKIWRACLNSKKRCQVTR